MQIVIDDSVFQNEANSVHISALAYACLGETPHSLHTSPPASFSEDGSSITGPQELVNWLSSISPTLVKKAYEAAICDGPLKVTRTLSNTFLNVSNNPPEEYSGPRFQLSPEKAAQFIRFPMKIFVENGANDGNFILSTAKSEWRKYLQEALTNAWCTFHHCGGSSIAQELERHSTIDLARSFAVFDSDALHPDDNPPDTIRKKELCIEHDVPFHCLNRRMIENYLPLQAFSQWAYREPSPSQEKIKRIRKFEAIRRLTASQRYHFNIRHGFKKARDEKYKDSPNSIFLGVNQSILKELDHGLSSNITDEFEPPHVMNWDSWIDKDGQREETADMIQRIVRNL
jgi:hypothetical protein